MYVSTFVLIPFSCLSSSLSLFFFNPCVDACQAVGKQAGIL
jgi:hypothetical protein